MRYSRIPGEGMASELIVETDNGGFNLSAVKRGLQDFGDLVKAAQVTDTPLPEITKELIRDAPAVSIEEITDRRLLPLEPDEVWAAGVTYKISEEARKDESESSGDLYMDVYEAERPEIFFKATPSRIVGPNESLGIRGDSEWNVPEPELGIVLHYDNIVGFTLGNDMSSRSIEGQNPLYLPQAKIYDRSCSLGPSIVPIGSDFDPENAELAMEIERNGTSVFSGSASTSEMVRSFTELVNYYGKHDTLPEWGVLLTGTTIVPDDDFSLRPHDVVEVKMDAIGTLRNDISEV